MILITHIISFFICTFVTCSAQLYTCSIQISQNSNGLQNGNKAQLIVEGLASNLFQVDRTYGLNLQFDGVLGGNGKPCKLLPGTANAQSFLQAKSKGKIISLEGVKETNTGLIGTPVIHIPNWSVLESNQNLTASFLSNQALRWFPEQVCGLLGYQNGKILVSHTASDAVQKNVIFRTDKYHCASLLVDIIVNKEIDEDMAVKLMEKGCFSNNKKVKKSFVLVCSSPISVSVSGTNQLTVATENCPTTSALNTTTTSSSTTALHVFPKRELNIINISTSNSPKNKNKIYTNKKGVCLGYRNDRDKTNESKLNGKLLTLLACNQSSKTDSAYLHTKGQMKGRLIYHIKGKKKCVDYNPDQKVLVMKKCENILFEFSLQKSNGTNYLSLAIADPGSYLSIDVYNSSPLMGLLFGSD